MSVTVSAREIVLASGSRARREMLAAAGVHFTVQPADVDEPAIRARMRAGGEKVGFARRGVVWGGGGGVWAGV